MHKTEEQKIIIKLYCKEFVLCCIVVGYLLDIGPFAGKAFVASYNVMRRKDGTQSPWEFFYHSKPDLERLRVFGVKGYSHVSREARRKLDATSVPVIFLGYAE